MVEVVEMFIGLLVSFAFIDYLSFDILSLSPIWSEVYSLFTSLLRPQSSPADRCVENYKLPTRPQVSKSKEQLFGVRSRIRSLIWLLSARL